MFVNILTHMRTALDPLDALFVRAKRAAWKRATTLWTLVIKSLRLVNERDAKRARFRLPDASFGANGLVDGLAETDWERIRTLVVRNPL